MLLVLCICIYQIVANKSKVYFAVLPLTLVAIGWNSSKTVIILLVIFILHQVLTNLKNNFMYISLVVFSIATIFIIVDDGVDRLSDRLENFNLNYSIESNHRWEIEQTFKRYEKYNLNISKPDNDFNDYDNFSDFYSYELNTENKIVLNTFNFLTKVFGREFQWFRFFHFTEFNQNDLIFGKGAGQSHQHLVLLIEKPHSLYFSTIYQFGLFGVLLLLLILGYLLIKFFLNKFHYVYLLGIYFFAIGIKSEFLFTHNQIVLFILFIFYCLFFEKEEINK